MERQPWESWATAFPKAVLLLSLIHILTDEIKALEQPGNGIVIKGFVSEEELAELYRTSRIVVVPLRYGAGVKGKVIEALYNGAPIVTTSIGAEGIPSAGDVMMIQDMPQGFADAVVTLYQNPDECRHMCHGTQEYIKQYYLSLIHIYGRCFLAEAVADCLFLGRDNSAVFVRAEGI